MPTELHHARRCRGSYSHKLWFRSFDKRASEIVILHKNEHRVVISDSAQYPLWIPFRNTLHKLSIHPRTFSMLRVLCIERRYRVLFRNHDSLGERVMIVRECTSADMGTGIVEEQKEVDGTLPKLSPSTLGSNARRF